MQSFRARAQMVVTFLPPLYLPCCLIAGSGCGNLWPMPWLQWRIANATLYAILLGCCPCLLGYYILQVGQRGQSSGTQVSLFYPTVAMRRIWPAWTTAGRLFGRPMDGTAGGGAPTTPSIHQPTGGDTGNGLRKSKEALMATTTLAFFLPDDDESPFIHDST